MIDSMEREDGIIDDGNITYTDLNDDWYDLGIVPHNVNTTK